ncbi:hypothetical protein A9Q84_10935 [Halobacteriovorax marinus]|uniref:Response regulatory domain-containing protein n=1 Tax=Halobacteriovorax marinus TaxID=97084 RepID=A0A1Y5F7U7_9BACT|nr:hypothetical protein A9Q84_10935 [Halobacteriovorax marinus]
MIVFLDDDADFTILLEKSFSNFGVDVAVFNSIQSLESVDALKSTDILCFDIKLNNENGIEYIKSIRDRFPNLSFLCFSNYVDLLEEELLSVGVRYHVVKSDDFDLLKDELSKILEERELLGLKAS